MLFLRDDDIPQSVATGVADIGIVGENEFVLKNEDAEIIKRLGFSKMPSVSTMPKDIEYPGVKWFHGKKIATSYPGILSGFLKREWGECGDTRHYGVGRSGAGHRSVDAIFRYCKFRFYAGDNRLKGSGGCDETESPADW